MDMTKIDLGQDMNTNILNIKCVSRYMMVIYNKQHLSNI